MTPRFIMRLAILGLILNSAGIAAVLIMLWLR